MLHVCDVFSNDISININLLLICLYFFCSDCTGPNFLTGLGKNADQNVLNFSLEIFFILNFHFLSHWLRRFFCSVSDQTWSFYQVFVFVSWLISLHWRLNSNVKQTFNCKQMDSVSEKNSVNSHSLTSVHVVCQLTREILHNIKRRLPSCSGCVTLG